MHFQHKSFFPLTTRIFSSVGTRRAGNLAQASLQSTSVNDLTSEQQSDTKNSFRRGRRFPRDTMIWPIPLQNIQAAKGMHARGVPGRCWKCHPNPHPSFRSKWGEAHLSNSRCAFMHRERRCSPTRSRGQPRSLRPAPAPDTTQSCRHLSQEPLPLIWLVITTFYVISQSVTVAFCTESLANNQDNIPWFPSGHASQLRNLSVLVIFSQDTLKCQLHHCTGFNCLGAEYGNFLFNGNGIQLDVMELLPSHTQLPVACLPEVCCSSGCSITFHTEPRTNSRTPCLQSVLTPGSLQHEPLTSIHNTTLHQRMSHSGCAWHLSCFGKLRHDSASSFIT